MHSRSMRSVARRSRSPRASLRRLSDAFVLLFSSRTRIIRSKEKKRKGKKKGKKREKKRIEKGKTKEPCFSADTARPNVKKEADGAE